MSPPPTLRPPAPIPARTPRPPRPAVPRRADHPRIAARRIAVRRSEGRRRLRRLLWAVGVLTLIAAAGGATRTALLDVDHVEVAGTARVPAAVVAAAVSEAGADLGTPLATVDEGAIARAVERLPGVADAAVSRRWPGTLEVQVVERVPIAALTSDGLTAVVAADGVVTAMVTAPPIGLPVLAGADGDLEPGAVVDAPGLLAVAAALPPEVAAAVSVVAAGDDPEEIELQLAAGGIARLGHPGQLADKLVAVATMLEQVDLACLATLDVRVPSAPAVTRTPGCSS